MSVDPHSPQTESSSHSSVIAAMRAFLRKLPVSIFLIVLFVHLGIGAWLLSARFGMTQDNQEQPIFVELLGNDSADGSEATEQEKIGADQSVKNERTVETERTVDSSPDTKAIAPAPQEQPQAEIALQPKPVQVPERPKVVTQKPSATPDSRPSIEVASEDRGALVPSTQASAGGGVPLGPRLVSHIDFLGAPPSPVYPARSKSRRQEGRVVVRVLVDASGRLRTLSLLKSSGFDLLDQAALDAVGKAQFKPYSENGIPLDRLADIPIDFVLKD